MQPPARNINRNYYNLFILGAELFDTDHFIVPLDRALSSYWTSDELRVELGELSDEAIEKIKTFPALFMPEAESLFCDTMDETSHCGRYPAIVHSRVHSMINL